MEDKIIQTHITILLYLMLIVYLKSFTINIGDMPKKLFTYIKVYYAFLIVITIVAFFRRLFLLTSLYITDTVNKLLNYVLLKDNKNEVNYVKSYASKSSSVHDLFFQNNLESEILNKYLNESKIDFYKYFLLYDDLIGNDKNPNFCLTNKNEVEQNEINYNQTQNNNYTPMEYKDPNQNIENNFINNDTYPYSGEINEASFSNSDAFYDVPNSQTDRYPNSFNPMNIKYTRKIYSFFFRKNNNTLTKKTSNKGKEKETQEPDEGTTSSEENEQDNNREENGDENRENIENIEKNNEDNFQKKSNKGKYIHNRIKSLKLSEDAYFQKHLTKLKHLKFVTFMLDLLSNYKKYIMIDKIIKHLSRCANNTNHNTLSSSIKLDQHNTDYITNPIHNNVNINNEKENDESVIKNINNLEKTPEPLLNNNCMRKNNNNKLENSNLFPSNIFGNMFNLDSEKKSQKPFFQNVNFQDDNSKDNTNVSTGDETKKNTVILKSILKKRNPSDLKNENNSKNKNQRHIRFNPKVQTLLFEKYSDDEEYIYNMNHGKKGLYKIFDDYNIKNSDIFSYYNMRNNLNSIFTDIINSVCVYKDKVSRKF